MNMHPRKLRFELTTSRFADRRTVDTLPNDSLSTHDVLEKSTAFSPNDPSVISHNCVCFSLGPHHELASYNSYKRYPEQYKA